MLNFSSRPCLITRGPSFTWISQVLSFHVLLFPMISHYMFSSKHDFWWLSHHFWRFIKSLFYQCLPFLCLNHHFYCFNCHCPPFLMLNCHLVCQLSTMDDLSSPTVHHSRWNLYRFSGLIAILPGQSSGDAEFPRCLAFQPAPWSVPRGECLRHVLWCFDVCLLAAEHEMGWT